MYFYLSGTKIKINVNELLSTLVKFFGHRNYYFKKFNPLQLVNGVNIFLMVVIELQTSGTILLNPNNKNFNKSTLRCVLNFSQKCEFSVFLITGWKILWYFLYEKNTGMISPFGFRGTENICCDLRQS